MKRLKDVMEEKLRIDSPAPQSDRTLQRSKSTISGGVLEVQEEDTAQKFDLSNYLYHKIEDDEEDYHIKLQVNFASHAFLPRMKELEFSCFDEREATVRDLERSREMKRGTSYGEQVETYLEDQFKKWTSTQDTGFEPRTSLRGAFTVPKDQIVAFINKARLEKDMNIKKLPNACNFVGWKKLYQQMMNLKTSELLDAMFKNYSIWRAEGVPREMTREKIREFLQPPGSMGNQNQDNVTEEDLSKIIKIGNYSDGGQDSAWKFENFTTWLLSEANDIEDPRELEVHQDMSQPLSHYLVNSSFETFVYRSGVNLKASYKAYEVLLRQGVRFIDMDIWDGDSDEGPLIPCVCKKGGLGAAVEKLKLDKVLQTIHENAFESSEYPVIISLNVQCDLENQKATARLFKEIFGENLLTEQVDPDEEELPSPEALKRKIILMAPEDKEQEEGVDSHDESFLGNVYFRDTGHEDKSWKPKEMVWKRNDKVMSFGSPRSAADIEVWRHKAFVGYIEKKNMREFIRGHSEKKSGNFLVRATNDSHDNFALTIYTGQKKHPDGILEVELKHNNSQFFINTDIDSKHQFECLDELVSFFQRKKISSQARLTSPMDLRNQQVHKYNDWFYGDLDPGTSADIMQMVKKKGAFLVRADPDAEKFVLEYFDGTTPQSIEIHQDPEGDLFPAGDENRKFESVTEAVNYFKTFRHANATSLGEAIQLKGQLLADEDGLPSGAERKVRRFSQACMLDKTGRRFHVDGVKVFAMPTHLEDPNSLDREQSYELFDTKMEFKALDSKALKFAHDKKIVIDLGDGGKIEVTKEDDIELLFEALKSQLMTTRTESGKSIKPQRNVSKGQARELQQLMVYCKSKKGQLTADQVETTNGYLRLRSESANKGIAGFIYEKELCGSFQHVTSTPEDQLIGQLVPLNRGSYEKYHRSILSQVHPQSRGSYNPLPFWSSGAQLVSQNLAELGPMLQINNAMFASNGRCGYVLKPEAQTSCIVSLKILEARHLFSTKTDDFLIPHIQVTVYGDQGKGEVVWDTATDSKGRNASCNALHTIWDAKFKNKGAHVIHNKDLAILNFALTEGDGFGQNSVVAQRTVRLANVRNGLRRITLRNERDIRPYHMAQVLVDIKVFTMDDIQQEDAKLNHTATYEAKCPNDPNEQQRIKMELTRAYNMKMKLQKRKGVLHTAQLAHKSKIEKQKKELAEREKSRIAFEQNAKLNLGL